MDLSSKYLSSLPLQPCRTSIMYNFLCKKFLSFNACCVKHHLILIILNLSLTSFCWWPWVLLLEEVAAKNEFLSALPKPFIFYIWSLLQAVVSAWDLVGIYFPWRIPLIQTDGYTSSSETQDSAIWSFVGSKENLSVGGRCDCPIWHDTG